MEFEDSGSDVYILDKLFNKSFSQYWTLFWKDYDFYKYKSVKAELESALKLFPDASFVELFYSARDSSRQRNYDDESEFSKSIEKDRLNKLNVINELQQSFELLTMASESMGFTSVNEDLDEVHSEYVKYLMLPYLIAHVMVEKPDLSNRFEILKKVEVPVEFVHKFQIFLNQFMNMMSRLKILRREELEVWEEKRPKNTSHDARDLRVNQASFERDLKKSVSQVFASSGSVEQFLQFNKLDKSTNEEVYRNTILDILKLFSIQSINHLNSIKMEMPFLELREKNRIAFSEDKVESSAPPGKPWFLHIDNNSKLDPSLVQTLYRKMVFLPGHNLPTISLDECARIEMEMDVKTIGCKGVEVKRKDSADLLEDELDEQESEKSSVCTDDAREWDDWKDDHPKGQGNKDVNIG
ncbi:uncharacterized protein TOT_010000108 [Theileria orientalis strain Shintoku]|uniref:TAP42-like family protein n=1 Tax=Theileria orientalis strain Shintoku TaxID=869250 RepID=J7M4J4_THEOR|nr:uncharacterized protein TOT_010000108 [Theileria orientalis strain Shintoku]PVC54235.1 hypothetical protein MACL_00003252 [Theileria orientalis]BAM38640.1 uncharacterized protein TOT_010000108 [Theileria orientalis strain Shintoku]|eukprot:XP_009688941.1 uncharacterized protein TOT_010000108 [Theileria orientalis strain Shintoku]